MNSQTTRQESRHCLQDFAALHRLDQPLAYHFFVTYDALMIQTARDILSLMIQIFQAMIISDTIIRTSDRFN